MNTSGDEEKQHNGQFMNRLQGFPVQTPVFQYAKLAMLNCQGWNTYLETVLWDSCGFLCVFRRVA